MRWFKRASQRDATFEDLAVVGDERYQALDALLCQSLITDLPYDITQKIRRNEDEAWNKDTTSTGLQVACMIYNYFKT